MSVQVLVDRIVEDGKITRDDQVELNHAIMAGDVISTEKQQIIDTLYAMLKEGKIKAV